jgi:hypothetical protein
MIKGFKLIVTVQFLYAHIQLSSKEDFGFSKLPAHPVHRRVKADVVALEAS